MLPYIARKTSYCGSFNLYQVRLSSDHNSAPAKFLMIIVFDSRLIQAAWFPCFRFTIAGEIIEI